MTFTLLESETNKFVAASLDEQQTFRLTLLLIKTYIIASFWESITQQTGREIKSNTSLKEL